MFKFIFLVVTSLAMSAEAGFFAILVEDAVYAIMRDLIEESGKSETYATCFIDVIRHIGVTDDVKNIKNFLRFDELIKTLELKGQIANFICQMGMPLPLFLFVAFCVVLVFLGCCFKCCKAFKSCCSDPQPVIIQLAAPALKSRKANPYAKMDQV